MTPEPGPWRRVAGCSFEAITAMDKDFRVALERLRVCARAQRAIAADALRELSAHEAPDKELAERVERALTLFYEGSDTLLRSLERGAAPEEPAFWARLLDAYEEVRAFRQRCADLDGRV